MRILALSAVLAIACSPLQSAVARAPVVAQVVSGGGWKTILTLYNHSDRLHRLSLEFYNDVGQPWPLRLVDSVGKVVQTSTSRSIQLDVPPKAVVVYETVDLGGAAQQGWLRVNSTLSSLGLFTVNAIVRQTIFGRPDVDSPAHLSACGRRIAMPFDQRNGAAVGAAILNASSSEPYSIHVTIYDASGNRLQELLMFLAPGSHEAFGLRDRFPITNGRLGSVEFYTIPPQSRVVTPRYVCAVGLLFGPTGGMTTINPAVIEE